MVLHHQTSLACLVSTLVRAEGWHSGGILSLSYAAGAWLLGSRYPRTTADTSHLTCAGLWADNSAHGDTARADDALTAAPHPSHHSCSVQFILMLIHAIDCGVMWSLDTPQLGRSTCSSQCLGVECPPPPCLPSPLCPDPASSELISNFTIFATVLPISLSAPR